MLECQESFSKFKIQVFFIYLASISLWLQLSNEITQRDKLNAETQEKEHLQSETDTGELVSLTEQLRL